MDRTEELIQRVANTRKTLQDIRMVESAAIKARRAAEDAYATAQDDLRNQVLDRVNALTPEREGDRC